MVSGYLAWWYGQGVIEASNKAVAILWRLTDSLSLPILLRTLFAPWKNDVLSARNIALSDQMKLWGQNFVSRFVGFLVRSIVIGVAVLLLAALCLVFALSLVVWLFAPMLVVALPIFGLVMMAQ